MAKLAKHVSRRKTAQTDPIYGRESEMKQNSAGGVTFTVDKFMRLRRFLALGSEGGAYYVNERKLTRDNAKCLEACADEDFDRTLAIVEEFSVKGLAPKQGVVIFAFALLCSRKNPTESGKALQRLSRICRTGTHLFQFVDTIEHLRGHGRALNRALQNWYLSKVPEKLAYQVTKYQQREGWSHRDILRLAKPKTADPVIDGIFGYIVGKPKAIPAGKAADWIQAVESAKKATTARQIVRLIENHNLVRECIPTRFLNDPDVWAAMLPSMPMMAMIRNLAKMTSIGLLRPLGEATHQVCTKLSNDEELRNARVHPVAILMAHRVYAQGRGFKGSLTWQPVPAVLDALDGAFVKAFQYVEPSHKRHLLAIDVSSSMSSPISGTCLRCCEGAAAMAMATARIEPFSHIVGFSSQSSCHWKPSNYPGRWGGNAISELGITAKTSLSDAMERTLNRNFGGTDCALPMLYAKAIGCDVDTFVVYTDNETWAGEIQPCQALEEYRQHRGHDAKLIVVGMTATDFTIADPKDPGMLDVVGFDASAPKVMADFSRGDI